MKPKAPKKKDIKPSAKSGEVREDKVIEHITLNLDWTKDNLYQKYYNIYFGDITVTIK